MELPLYLPMWLTLTIFGVLLGVFAFIMWKKSKE